jgi:hypothetical protein
MRKLLTLAMLGFLSHSVSAFGRIAPGRCRRSTERRSALARRPLLYWLRPNFSTTGTNRIMRICTGLAQGSATGASVTVTSITDTNSLAWNLRGRKNAQMIGTPWLDIECWDALAAATQTNNQVVAHFSATIDDALSWYSRSAATTPSTCMIRVVPLFL